MKNKEENPRVYLALTILCFLLTIKQSAQSIPNGSFENWTPQIVGTETVLTADYWLGSYTQGSSPVSPIQSTDHIDGDYGIEIETTQWPIAGTAGGIVSCTFPMNTQPLFINGYFKSTRVDATGTGQVLIQLKNNGTIIGEGLFTTNSNVNIYTLFSQAITYTSNLTPDEATIWLCSEGIFGVNTENLGNKLWIDQLTFSDTPLYLENTAENATLFSMFPNPSKDLININLKNHHVASLTITNALGQRLRSELLIGANNSIPIGDFERGIYFVELEIADRIVVTKFIKD
jgi:Secretion system C-terminal sorting domain